MSPTDTEWMEQTLAQGKKGHPSPNPHVGAILVKENRLVSLGYHARAGERHAEVMAIEAAGDQASGSTLYVSLEPCNHHGRTPPCVSAIVNAGIKRVVIGCKDPNPHVQGGGIETLRRHGIDVTVGTLEAEALELISPWMKYVTKGIPYVSLKLALSLDGRIASRAGTSKWITGKLARAKVHSIRAGHDVVAVGIGTATADDPRLTVRESPGQDPVRMVFDTHLRIAHTQKLIATAHEIPTWIVCGVNAPLEREEALAARGVDVIRAEMSSEGRVNVFDALEKLAKRGVVRLMVEGGAELAGSFLAARVVDELHAFLAPILLGPRGRPGAVDWAGPDTPANAPRIENPSWELCGVDAYVHGRILYPEEE